MNNPDWCVVFAINDKVQNFTTCYNTTENAVYEYCREEDDRYSEESGRSFFQYSNPRPRAENSRDVYWRILLLWGIFCV